MLKIIDNSVFVMGQYFSTVGTCRKFEKYWGHNDAVFNERMYIYPKHLITENTKKFLKMIGSYDEVMASNPQGVESVWLYLNPNKITGTSVAYFNKEIIEQSIEEDIPLQSTNVDGTINYNWKNVSVIYDISQEIQSSYWNKKVKPTSSSLQDLSGEQIWEYTLANWEYLHNNTITISDIEESDNVNAYGKFFLYPIDPTEFVREFISAGRTISTGTKSMDDPEGGSYTIPTINTHVYINFRIRRIGSISDSGTIVTTIYNKAKDADVYEIYNMLQNSPFASYFTATNDMFLSNKLRVSYWNALKYKDRLKLWPMLIDQGYQKKKVKWYKKLLVIIIVIAAVYIFGPGGLKAGATAGEVLAYVASVATVVAITFSLIALYASKTGDLALAEWSGNMGKIAGTIALITGLMVMTTKISQIATDAARKEALNTALKEGMTEFDAEILAEQAEAGISDYIKAIYDTSTNSWSRAISTIGKAFDYYFEHRLKDIDASTEAAKQKATELEQEIALDTDFFYTTTLAPMQFIQNRMAVLDNMKNEYYVEAAYQPQSKWNIGPKGHVSKGEIFKPGYLLT